MKKNYVKLVWDSFNLCLHNHFFSFSEGYKSHLLYQYHICELLKLEKKIILILGGDDNWWNTKNLWEAIHEGLGNIPFSSEWKEE